MEYVGSRGHLDTLNRLWHLDHGGMLPPAREDPAPIERARTSAEQRDVAALMPALARITGPSPAYTVYDLEPCPCAKCQKAQP